MKLTIYLKKVKCYVMINMCPLFNNFCMVYQITRFYQLVLPVFRCCCHSLSLYQSHVRLRDAVQHRPVTAETDFSLCLTVLLSLFTLDCLDCCSGLDMTGPSLSVCYETRLDRCPTRPLPPVESDPWHGRVMACWNTSLCHVTPCA